MLHQLTGGIRSHCLNWMTQNKNRQESSRRMVTSSCSWRNLQQGAGKSCNADSRRHLTVKYSFCNSFVSYVDLWGNKRSYIHVTIRQSTLLNGCTAHVISECTSHDQRILSVDIHPGTERQLCSLGQPVVTKFAIALLLASRFPDHFRLCCTTDGHGIPSLLGTSFLMDCRFPFGLPVYFCHLTTFPLHSISCILSIQSSCEDFSTAHSISLTQLFH